MGARAYSIVQRLGKFQPDECVIEIGSERGEGSTRWLARFCARNRVTFHTVDVDPGVHLGATELIKGYRGCAAHQGRGEEFLANELRERVRFAYLDGFDYIPAGLEDRTFIGLHRKRYAELGLELTNESSAASHLIQAALVDIHSAPSCAILIDDTGKNGNGWLGKGALAMPYLQSRGYEVFDLIGAGLATKAVMA